MRVDEVSDCDEGLAGFVLVGCCGVALGVGSVGDGSGGVEVVSVSLVTVAVLGGTVVFDLGLTDEVVCVAMEVVVGAVPDGDASRLRRIVLTGSTLGSLPAIDSWATCCSI